MRPFPFGLLMASFAAGARRGFEAPLFRRLSSRARTCRRAREMLQPDSHFAPSLGHGRRLFVPTVQQNNRRSRH
jgi:hypothetical protein